MSRILLLTTMYPSPNRPGTDVCHYFARGWNKMGHDVIVVHMRSCFPMIYQKLANLIPRITQKYFGAYLSDMSNHQVVRYEMDGVRVIGLPLVKIIPHSNATRRCLKATREFIIGELGQSGWVPDAIVGHFSSPQLELIPKLKAWYPEAKTTLVLHSTDTPGQIKRNHPFGCKHLLSSFDSIGYRSVKIRDQFAAVFGNDYHFFHCYSGLPSDFYSDGVKRHFEDGPLHSFLYVGQFIRRKYPKELMSALCTVYGTSPFHLTYVGKKDVMYDDLAAYANERGIAGKVCFTGKLNRSEIIDYYDDAACFAMISRDETFGLVYLEAMSRGCLVIASRKEGMDGLIVDGQNGFLCAAGDAAELAEVIKRINAMSGEEKTRISNAAVSTALRMTDEAAAKDYYFHIFNN